MANAIYIHAQYNYYRLVNQCPLIDIKPMRSHKTLYEGKRYYICLFMRNTTVNYFTTTTDHDRLDINEEKR